MSEEEAKKLVHKSMLKTSDGFVDELMNKIEAKEHFEKQFVWSPRVILAGIGIVLLVMSFILYRLLGGSMEFLNTGLSVSKTAIFLLASFIFLFIINYLVRLNEDYKYLKSNV